MQLINQEAIAVENAGLYEGLQQVNNELEARVQERIAELVVRNKHLKSEIVERQYTEARLVKEYNLLRTLFDNLPNNIYVKDTQGQFLVANAALAHTLGVSEPEELIGKTDFDFYPPELAEKYHSDERKIFASGDPLINQEEPFINPSTGEMKWILTSKIPFRDSQGNIAGILGIGHDITERKQTQDLLEQQNRELRLLKRLNELHTCQSEEETYEVFAIAYQQLFPKDSGCLYLFNDLSNTMKAVISWGNFPLQSEESHVDECQTFYTKRMAVFETPESALTCSHFQSLPKKSYLCVPILTSEKSLGVLTLCFDQALPGIDSKSNDKINASKRVLISKIVEYYALSLTNLRLREKLRSESIRDSLTGLYNRRYMKTVLKQEEYRIKRHQSGLGIIMLDVDHFKAFNDTHGHEAGDIVLRELGYLLQHNFRGEDVACRYGGEEFLLIMSGASLEAARQRAEEILLRSSNLNIEYDKQTFSITVSVGVAALPYHGSEAMDVVRAADNAMYMAKTGGRNRVVVAPIK